MKAIATSDSKKFAIVETVAPHIKINERVNNIMDALLKKNTRSSGSSDICI